LGLDADLPDGLFLIKKAFLRAKALPLSVIDLHPQSPDIDFIAAKTCSAATSDNRAHTGIDRRKRVGWISEA
jgi:hypothetical protein